MPAELKKLKENTGKRSKKVKAIYPDSIHMAIADGLSYNDFNIKIATLDEPEHGLTVDLLDETDVLIWWGHCAHAEVKDEIVKRVHDRVMEGIGMIVLHSGYYSKIFKTLMGTSCSLKYRVNDDKQLIWNIEPSHQITQGIGDYIKLPKEEMYGERFDIPTPDKTLFIGWFEGGKVFRSGCCFQRGHGRSHHKVNPEYFDIPDWRRKMSLL